jgi:putative ABC transport system permease protein
MFDREIIVRSFATMRQQGLRSNLTILGIVIGIAAIISLISLGNSLNQSVSAQFDALGTNTLAILPGKSFATAAFSKLEEDDVRLVEGVRGVDFAAAAYIHNKQVSLKNENRSTLIVGFDAGKLDNLQEAGIIELETGNLPEPKSFRALLGKNVAEGAFARQVKEGQSIKIEDKNFKVSGTIKNASNFFSNFFSNAILIDQDALQQIHDTDLAPSRMFVILEDGIDTEAAKARISHVLEKAHGEEDFQVQDTQTIAQTAAGVIGVIQLVLVAIAAIALVVGGIGVMNSMFMNVTERTKEIGIMKAVGATNNQIMALFITEAAVVGVVGGILGVLLGFGLAFGISLSSGGLGIELPFFFDPLLGLFGILFAVIVSVVSGLLPARSAAILDPIEALRFEN